jgi:hypothetical protein
VMVLPLLRLCWTILCGHASWDNHRRHYCDCDCHSRAATIATGIHCYCWSSKLHLGSVGPNVARKLLENQRLHRTRNLRAIHIAWEGSGNRG